MKERSRTNQFIINFGAQVFVFASNFAISFFLTPFIIKNIGREAYGFVGLANNFINYITVLTTALNSMFGRFVTISIYREEELKTNKYFSSVFFANIFVSIPLTVASVFVVIFINKLVNISNAILTDVQILWAFLFAEFITGLIFSVFTVATFTKNRLDLASLRNIESSAIRVVILVVMFRLLKPSVWFLGFAAFICGMYVVFMNIYYTKKLLPEVKIKKKYFDFKMVVELITSGIWNSVNKLSGILSNGLDLLITNLFVTSQAMGIVSISKTVPTYILSAFSTISSLFAPELTISYAKNDFEDMRKQLLSAIKMLGFFSSIPISFIYIFGKEFYSLWVPTEDAALLHMLTVLGMLAAAVGWPLEPLWNIFTITNKVKQSSLFLLSNAVLSTLLVFILLNFTDNETTKMCVVVGVSTTISVIRSVTFLPMYGAKCLNFKLTTFFPTIIKNTVSIVVISLSSLLLKQFVSADTWFKLILCGVIVSAFSCIFNWFFLLGKAERNKIISKLSKIVK